MIGSHLKTLRDRAKLSQEQLAKALGFKRQSSISAIECEENGIDAGVLARWLDVVGASQEDRIRALQLAGAGEAAVPDRRVGHERRDHTRRSADTKDAA